MKLEDLDIDAMMAEEGISLPSDDDVDSLMAEEGIPTQPIETQQQPSMEQIVLPRTTEALSQTDGQPYAGEEFSDDPLRYGESLSPSLEAGKNVIPDLMDFLTRSVAAIRGEEGKTRSETMATPEANILNPEIKEAVDYWDSKALKAEESGNGALSKFYKTMGGLVKYGAPNLGDPTVVLGAANRGPKTAASIVEKSRVPRNVLGGVSEAGAKKTQQIILSPKQQHLKSGFDIDNVFKHNVQGSVDEVLEKTQSKIDDAARRLRELIKKGDTPDIKIDPKQAVNELQREILKDRVKNASMSQELPSAFKKLRNIIDFALGDNKTFGLVDAQDFKQQLGLMGEWEYVANQRGFQLDKETTALSQMASRLYKKLNERISKNAPDGLKEINRELTELIPIKNTAASRKAVTDRASIVSLGDMMGTLATIGGGLKGLALWAAVRGQKAGTTAKSLYALSKKLQKATDPKDVQRLTKSLEKIGITKAEINLIQSLKEDESDSAAAGVEATEK